MHATASGGTNAEKHGATLLGNRNSNRHRRLFLASSDNVASRNKTKPLTAVQVFPPVAGFLLPSAPDMTAGITAAGSAAAVATAAALAGARKQRDTVL